MGDGATESRVLYLTACDSHARSKDGTPMVAGGQFSAPNGYPVLPWGCGPLYHLDPKAPRWLVLEPDKDGLTSTPNGVRMTAGRIVADGSQQDALRYLHTHGGSGMPYIARRRRGGDHAVLTVGSMGEVEVSAHGVVGAGEGSRLKGDAGLVAAAGPRSTITGAEFIRVAIGDQGRANTDRFALIAAGTEAQIDAGDGSIVTAASGSTIKVGAGSRAMVEGGGSIDLGARAVGVGQSSTRFRGRDGAFFLVIDAVVDGAPQSVSARVGLDGILADRWYVLSDGRFVEVTS